MNKPSENFTNLMIQLEGEELVGYKDSAGLPSVGIGHLIKKGEPYRVGKSITLEESRRLFADDTRWAVVAVNSLVKVPLTQNQFDSICSLVFNVGIHAFSGSSVLRKLNQGAYQSAADHFLDWVKEHRKGKLIISDGLVNRRKQEKK